MTATDTAIGDDDSLLAAEYVLRLLKPGEEQDFESRLLTDRGLMAAVAGWASRLSGMDDEVAEVVPHRSVKAGLTERLFGAEEKPRSILERLGLWQAVSFASLGLAAFLAWQSLQVPQPAEPVARGPLYVSEIAAEDQSLRILAVYDSDAGRLQVNRTAGQAAPGRALELWAIAGDSAPVSLGVLPEGSGADVPLPAGLRAQVAGLTLAISDEPPGGSPTGQPTGAVLAVGQVTEL